MGEPASVWWVAFVARRVLHGPPWLVRLVTSVTEWQADERGQIAHSSAPFKGSEAFWDACRNGGRAKTAHRCSYATHTHTHAHFYPPLPSFFTPQLSSLPVSLLRLLCFTTSGSARFFIEGLHLAVLGALLLVQSLSLISDLPRLSVCFYVQGFFFYLHLLSLALPPVCCRRAFIPPHLLTKKLFRVSASQGRPLAQTDAVGKHSRSTKDLLHLFFFAISSKGMKVRSSQTSPLFIAPKQFKQRLNLIFSKQSKTTPPNDERSKKSGRMLMRKVYSKLHQPWLRMQV